MAENEHFQQVYKSYLTEIFPCGTMKTMKTYLESYLVVARIVPTKTPKATQNARSRDTMIRLLKAQAQKVGVKVPVNTLYNNLYKESLTKLYKIFG